MVTEQHSTSASIRPPQADAVPFMRFMGCMLAFCVGVLNFTVVLFFGVCIGYVTGDTVDTVTDGTADITSNRDIALLAVLVVASYIVGAALGGFFSQNPWQPGRRVLPAISFAWVQHCW